MPVRTTPLQYPDEDTINSWEIESRDDGLCMLTVTHDRLEAAPKTAANVSGPGWTFVLSGLKTFVETGDAFV